MMIELGKYAVFLIPGILYGLVTGVFAGIWLCAGRLVKKNVASEEKTAIQAYSSRGLEVFNRNMADEFTTNIANQKKKNLFDADYDEDNLEYFKRNVDFDYTPPVRQVKVPSKVINKRRQPGKD